MEPPAVKWSFGFFIDIVLISDTANSRLYRGVRAVACIFRAMLSSCSGIMRNRRAVHQATTHLRVQVHVAKMTSNVNHFPGSLFRLMGMGNLRTILHVIAEKQKPLPFYIDRSADSFSITCSWLSSVFIFVGTGRQCLDTQLVCGWDLLELVTTFFTFSVRKLQQILVCRLLTTPCRPNTT